MCPYIIQDYTVYCPASLLPFVPSQNQSQWHYRAPPASPHNGSVHCQSFLRQLSTDKPGSCFNFTYHACTFLAYCLYLKKKNHPFQTLQRSWILSEVFGFVSKRTLVTLVLITRMFIYETTKYDCLYFPSWKMDPWKALLSTPMCPGQLSLVLFRCQPGGKCLLLLHSEARLTSDSVSLQVPSNFMTWCVFIYLRLSFLRPLVGTTCFKCSDQSMTLKFCSLLRANEEWPSPRESRPRHPLCQENSLQLEPEEAAFW